METKLVRIAEISATSKHPIFTSVYHLINEDMLKQCHKELDGNKAVGIDRVLDCVLEKIYCDRKINKVDKINQTGIF